MGREVYESVLNDLEIYHSGAYLMNEVELTLRLERAILAFQANTEKEIFSEGFKEYMFTNFDTTVKKTLREFYKSHEKDDKRKKTTLKLGTG